MEGKGFSSLKEGRGWYLEACKCTRCSGRAGPDLTASAGGKRWRDEKDKSSCLSAIQVNCLYFIAFMKSLFDNVFSSCFLLASRNCFMPEMKLNPGFYCPVTCLCYLQPFGVEGLPRLLVKDCGLQLLHLDAFISFVQGSRFWALTFMPGSSGDRSLHRDRNRGSWLLFPPYELNGILPLLLWDPHPPRDSSKQEKSCQHTHSSG